MRAISFLTACAFIVALVSTVRADANSSPRISLEGIYWRPTGLDFSVVSPGAGNGNLSGSSQGISYDFAPGYHLAIEWKSFRVSWIDLQTQSNFNAECPPGTGNCMKSVQRGSSGEFTGSGVASASAWSTTRLQLLDADFLRPIGGDSDPTFTASFGVRYARILNATRTFYRQSPAKTDELQTQVVNNMLGLRAGVSAEYKIHTTLRLSAAAALSLLNGRSKGDASEFGSTTGPSQIGATFNTTSSAVELGLKMAYTPVDSCDVWLGIVFLKFGDGLVEQSTVGSAAQFTTQVSRHDVSFMGPSLGLRWHF